MTQNDSESARGCRSATPSGAVPQAPPSHDGSSAPPHVHSCRPRAAPVRAVRQRWPWCAAALGHGSQAMAAHAREGGADRWRGAPAHGVRVCSNPSESAPIHPSLLQYILLCSNTSYSAPIHPSLLHSIRVRPSPSECSRTDGEVHGDEDPAPPHAGRGREHDGERRDERDPEVRRVEGVEEPLRGAMRQR